MRAELYALGHALRGLIGVICVTAKHLDLMGKSHQMFQGGGELMPPLAWAMSSLGKGRGARQALTTFRRRKSNGQGVGPWETPTLVGQEGKRETGAGSENRRRET